MLRMQGLLGRDVFVLSSIVHPRSLKGVFDLRPALEAVLGGYVLTAKQLEGLADTLEAIFEAKEVATRRAADDAPQFPELAIISQGIDEGDRSTLRAIRDCIQVSISATMPIHIYCTALQSYQIASSFEDTESNFIPNLQRGYVSDDASEALKAVRGKRAENKGLLRTLMDEQVCMYLGSAGL